MKQEVCLLPVRCRGCGTVFDLWYDLQLEQEQGEMDRIQEGDFRKLVKQSFCWYCRKVVSGDSDESGNTEEPDVQTELEFSLSYE